MPSSFLWGFVRGLVTGFLFEGGKKSLDYLMIKAVETYIRAVNLARKSVAGLIALFLVGLLMLAGFLFIHAGAMIVLDLDLKTAGIVILCLGGFYFLIGAVVFGVLTSEKTWMRISKGSEFVERVTKKNRSSE